MKARICTLIFSIAWLNGTAISASYRVAENIGKGQIGTISQLANGPDHVLYALETNGRINIFNPEGHLRNTFETDMSNTEAMAASAEGHLYVLSTLTQTKRIRRGVRMHKVEVPTGVACAVFDTKGQKLKTLELDTLKSAKAARIVGNRLIVADIAARALVYLDVETGEEMKRVKKGLRLCCGIFDFCEAPDRTVAVANLGAFKVQRFDLEGSLLSEFGQRGRSLDDFQGCCNPVSAGYLPDGQIVTVEKDPTRIKIYDADGTNAQQIPGVEELVKGCRFIPMTVNSKGTIYLAAVEKGYIVKCVPQE